MYSGAIDANTRLAFGVQFDPAAQIGHFMC
jgi:hypothetical protein